VTGAIIAKQRLIEQTRFFIIVKLEPTPLLAAHDRSKRFVNECLCPDWQVLVVKVIMRYHVVCALEQLYIMLDILQLELLLSLQE
jgi:hypothetical protein